MKVHFRRFLTLGKGFHDKLLTLLIMVTQNKHLSYRH